MTAVSRATAVRPFDQADQSVAAQAAWIAVFASLTALAAQVEVAHYPVPYTLQTLVVLLAGAFLGWRNGAISQLAYLAAGALGAPVFSMFGFGIGRLIGPTGGYLLAFPAAAAIVGFLVTRRRSLWWTFASMGAGLLVIFVSGTVQLQMVLVHDWVKAISGGFLIFSLWDLVKVSAAAMTYHEIARRFPRVPKNG
jgi:biotin transport system substrate-specific component